jgi:hypothetical protein
MSATVTRWSMVGAAGPCVLRFTDAGYAVRSLLGDAFNRMRRSLAKALKRIE